MCDFFSVTSIIWNLNIFPFIERSQVFDISQIITTKETISSVESSIRNLPKIEADHFVLK